MYFQGPFLALLKNCPEVGLELTIRLVNFATERWADRVLEPEKAESGRVKSCSIQILLTSGLCSWTGDVNVFGWHDARLISAPAVISALMALESWLYELAESDEDLSGHLETVLSASRSAAFGGVLVALGLKHPKLFLGPLKPLLGVWQLYEWQLVLLQDSGLWRIGFSSWVRFGERIFREVNRWHTMEHRQKVLQLNVVQWILFSEHMRDYFVEVRKDWKSQLANTREREELELLIARFDPENYKLKDQPDGRVAVQLQWPKSLRTKTERSARQSADAIDVLNFPNRCRQIMDKGEPLSDSELEAFELQLRRLANLLSDPKNQRGMRRREDIVCAGLAVLMTFHTDWLRADQERERWSQNELRCILESPPVRDSHDIDESTNPNLWDRFLGECAICVLADDRESEAIRSLICRLVVTAPHETVALLMRAAYRQRSKLNEDFQCLLNVVIAAAGLRAVGHYIRDPDEENRVWLRWASRLRGAYVRGGIPKVLWSWERVSTVARRLIHSLGSQPRIGHLGPPTSPSRIPADRPALDVEFLRSALDFLPQLTETSDERERVRTLWLLKESLQTTLKMIPKPRDQDWEPTGTPLQFDRWVFDRVAQAIPQMIEAEQPEKLWKPILELGPRAHYWVSDFLSSWIFQAVSPAPDEPSVRAQWKQIIRHGLDSASWDPTAPSGHHVEEMFWELLGLRLAISRISSAEFSGVVGELAALYQEWAGRWLRSGRSAEQFAYLVSKPGGSGLLPGAIVWLEEAVKSYSSHQWHGRELDSSLVAALRACWHQCRQEIDTKTKVREAFNGLLSILVARGNHEALEFRDRIVR